MKAAMIPLACALGCATAAYAQKHAEEPTSTVSGRVFCADTNAPARTATVTLEPVDMAEGMKADMAERHYSFHGERVQTLLDGSFTIRHVEPGTYYVVANQAGYLAPLAAPNEPQAESATPQPVAAQKPPVSAPRITSAVRSARQCQCHHRARRVGQRHGALRRR